MLLNNEDRQTSAASSSITFNSGTLTLSNDADLNNIANIGDIITIEVNITNTDNAINGDCTTATPTVTADLSAYGWITPRTLTLQICNNGAGDVWSLDFIVLNAETNGIDVGAADVSSQVNITATDIDDMPGINLYSSSLAQPVDTIAPIVETTAISVTGATGAGGTIFKLGDTPILQWDAGIQTDIVSVTMDGSQFRSFDSNLIAVQNGAIWEASLTDVLDELDNTTGNIVVNVTDDAGNVTSTWGTNDYLIDTIVPTVTALLGNGSHYSLPSTCPSAACNRGDIYGARIDFSEELEATSKTAVENAITTVASTSPRVYVWSGSTVRIYATAYTSFENDVIVSSFSDLAGNESLGLLLIDSQPGQNEVWVDDDYIDIGTNDGHTWGVDAFNNIQLGINAILSNSTVHVAAGNYDEEIEINIPTVVLQGDTGDANAGPGLNAPVINDTVCNTRTLNINANNVTVEGLSISSVCSYPSIRVANGISGANILDNELSSNYTGVGLSPNSTNSTVMRNLIHNNTNGITIGGSQSNTISNNDVYDNTNNGIYFKCGNGGSDCDSSGTVVSTNNIYGNLNGVYFDAGDQNTIVTVGPDNNVHDNSDGVYINGNGHNFLINDNKIYSNTGFTSGLHVESDTTGLDASNNWWGDVAGPVVTDDSVLVFNEGGIGETININNSNFIFYRPFCIEETCNPEQSSVVTVDPENLAGLFESGVFVLPFGEDPANVSNVETAEDLTIELPDGSFIEIPTGVIITEEGGLFNPSNLDANEVNVSTLTGLGSGVVAEGAIEWGISTLHLEFNPAITLNIFVGTDKNGQTLDVKRSTDGVTWTSDGIVSPATCVVSEGICQFQATKASTYVSTSTSDTASPTTTGGNSGSYMPGYGPKALALALANLPPACQVGDLFNNSTGAPCLPVKALASTGLVPVKVFFSQNLMVSSSGEDVRNLQKYLNAQGFSVALSGPGSKGFETNYFGPLTKAALLKFQEANALYILTPHGLIKGTGNLGLWTRSFINSR